MTLHDLARPWHFLSFPVDMAGTPDPIDEAMGAHGSSMINACIVLIIPCNSNVLLCLTWFLVDDVKVSALCEVMLCGYIFCVRVSSIGDGSYENESPSS